MKRNLAHSAKGLAGTICAGELQALASRLEEAGRNGDAVVQETPWVAERAPEGWKAARQHAGGPEDLGYEPLSEGEEEVEINARKRAWARLLAKVYELDPLVCPKCGADMKVIAVIEDPDEIKRILQDLVKMGRSPWAVPTGIRSRSAQLIVSSLTLHGRRR